MRSCSKKKVLMIGPDIKNSHGGIASVLKSYNKTHLWDKYQITILDPYSEKGNILKIYSFIKASVIFIPKISKSDIVHLHLGGHISFLRKSFFLFLSKICKKKTILHFHNIKTIKYLTNGSKLLTPILDLAVNLADVMVVLSTSMKNELESLHKGKTIKILHNASHIPDKNKRMIEKNSCSIFYAGVICKDKGCYDLINSFRYILKRKPHAKLVMAGNGEIKEIKKIAKDTGIEMSVRLTGWLNNNELEKEYKNATIFCLPSYTEGMPMALLEAMGYGLPVVTTPVGVITDFIKSGENGIITPVGDVKMLYENIIKLLDNHELRKKIGFAGKKFVTSECNSDKIAQKLDSIYSNIL